MPQRGYYGGGWIPDWVPFVGTKEKATETAKIAAVAKAAAEQAKADAKVAKAAAEKAKAEAEARLAEWMKAKKDNGG